MIGKIKLASFIRKKTVELQLQPRNFCGTIVRKRRFKLCCKKVQFTFDFHLSCTCRCLRVWYVGVGMMEIRGLDWGLFRLSKKLVIDILTEVAPLESFGFVHGIDWSLHEGEMAVVINQWGIGTCPTYMKNRMWKKYSPFLEQCKNNKVSLN